MTYRAELDTLIHLHALSTVLLRNQGLVKVRVFLFHKNEKGERQFAHPYSIIKAKPEQRTHDSFIDENSQGYYTKATLVSYDPDQYVLDEACLFRSYVPVDRLAELQMFCIAELLFCPDYLESEKSVFEIYGVFESRISRLSKLADYLPIAFDEFEGCLVKATYHSTILEFKFIKQQDDHDSQYYDFWSYMQAITNGCKQQKYSVQKAKIRRFYSYYRNCIEEEFVALQQHFAQVLSACGESEQRRLKFTRNTKLENDIDWLANFKTAAFNQQAVNNIIEGILHDFTILKGICYDFWNRYVELVLQRSAKFTLSYSNRYRNRVIERLKTNVFSHSVKGQDWTVAHYDDYGNNNILQAEKERNKDYKQLWEQQFPIENLTYFPDQKKAVKLFEESYNIAPLISKSMHIISDMPQLHVFVLVHGFQASHKDFALIKNYLLARDQPTEVLLSVVNEGRTNFNIETLGSRLAVEVSDFLNNRLNKQRFRLSFIGHSMGGVIVRAALKHIERFWPHLYSYISLSAPHLGYLSNCSKIIEAGLWYLNKWEKCDSIRQLMMIDAEDPTKSFLYKLSQENGLKHFKKVALLSSYQDGFVSHESARIQKSQQLINNALKNDRKQFILQSSASLICHMVDSILPNTIQNLYRIDVVFQIEERNIDSLVGRTGHIKFLSDSYFLKTLINTFDHLFK